MVLTKAQWTKQFFKLSHRYHQTFKSMETDIKFFFKLLDDGLEKEALIFYSFCEEVYTQNPKTEWSRARHTAWRKDIFAATTHELIGSADRCGEEIRSTKDWIKGVEENKLKISNIAFNKN